MGACRGVMERTLLPKRKPPGQRDEAGIIQCYIQRTVRGGGISAGIHPDPEDLLLKQVYGNWVRANSVNQLNVGITEN